MQFEDKKGVCQLCRFYIVVLDTSFISFIVNYLYFIGNYIEANESFGNHLDHRVLLF